MGSSAEAITLTDNGNLLSAQQTASASSAAGELRLIGSDNPILRIPSFPGATLRTFALAETVRSNSAEDVADAMRRLRVGGSFWGRQPSVPGDHVVVRSLSSIAATTARFGGKPLVVWEAERAARSSGDDDLIVVIGECDPWHVLGSASALVTANPDDELLVIAGLIGLPCYLDQDDGLVDVTHLSTFGGAIYAEGYENPFTGQPMTALEAVELCGFWRKLIDSNRDLSGGLGFAFWKQPQIAPLLWAGTGQFHFRHSAEGAKPGEAIAIWRSKAPVGAIAELERMGVHLVEVEDGFLRSRGLGADCIPPLSITVDRRGPHFDPSSASDLELLLQDGQFDEELLTRASELRRLIIESGLGKYEQGGAALDRPAGKRRHILVPGQVEDDRAVQLGGAGLVSNLELLKRVRDAAPDAFILYKPHPDVLAGHRRGAIADRQSLQYADLLVGDLPIASLIEMVDEVHVNTSLAGFEALLRCKVVATYGVPFYAGWGLTHDLGPVPDRRTAKRTVDELVAATLLLYPRYLDPVTGLPCPAEILVARLTAREQQHPGLLVGFRRFQGKLLRRLRSLVQ